MLCNFSVCSILLCGDFSVGWISCSNRAVTLLLWKGTVARLKRSDLYPTGLFFCSCIFFQSSHCSSSESTKPHTLDANTKVTCSWLCFLSKIIIENITGWPTVTDWKSHFCPQDYLQILFIMVGLKRYQCAFLIDLGKAVNKTRIPQQWRELSMRASYKTVVPESLWVARVGRDKSQTWRCLQWCQRKGPWTAGWRRYQ